MKYIAFEGVDGLGKSTQIAAVAKHLHCRCISEPSALGAQLKNLATSKLDSCARMFLFLADRAQLFAELEQSHAFAHDAPILLSDRSLVSHIAYALDFAPDELLRLNLLATRSRTPSAIVYFHASSQLLAERLGAKDCDELEDLAYLQKVAANYERALGLFNVPILRADASWQREFTTQKILEFINNL